MIVPFVLGVATTIGAISFARRRPGMERHSVAGYDPTCAVSIILFSAIDKAGGVIDSNTRGAGFSHAAIDGCEVTDDDEPLLIDARPGHGVFRRPLSDYEPRPYGRIVLVGNEAAEFYGCARARVGLPFDPLYSNCSQLVYSCLPRHLQVRVDAAARFRGPGGMVSPNQLAHAFGACVGCVVMA